MKKRKKKNKRRERLCVKANYERSGEGKTKATLGTGDFSFGKTAGVPSN